MKNASLENAKSSGDLVDRFCIARFYIDGMSCSACSASIQRALERRDFIKSAQINLIAKSAIIKYDNQKADLSDIFAIISKLGFSPYLAQSSTQETPKSNLKFNKTNPKSPQDFPKSTQNIFSNPTQNPTQNLAKNLAQTQNPSNIFAQIFAKIKSLIDTFNALDKKFLPPKIRVFISIITTLFVLYLSMFPMFVEKFVETFGLFSDFSLIPPFDDAWVNITAQIVCALVVAHIGRDFYFKGFATLFAKTPTMDSLIAISTTSAFVYSLWLLFGVENAHLHEVPHLYFESICVIITFVFCGKTLESSAKTEANEVINALLSRNAKNAIKLKSSNIHLTNNEISVPVGEIKEGDLLKILPFSFIPVDGVVESGSCAIDESSLSGEILPVPKSINSPLFAGSLNTSHAFVMRATSSAEHSTLSAMIALVEEAITSKPNISRIADKIASVFVPAVIFIALIAGGIWSVAKDFSFGFEIFISVLVISCPCALGLATPLAVMIGNALANKNGIFFKNAQSFEIASKVNNAVFDKTGTLTESKLKVCEILSLSELSKQEILALSAGLESGSEHIIANAILSHAKNAKLATRDTHATRDLKENSTFLKCEFSDFVAYAGLGIKATLKGFDFVDLSAKSSVDSSKEISSKSSDTKSTKSNAKSNLAMFQKGQIFALGSAKFFYELDSSVRLDSLEDTAQKEAICVYLGVQNQQSYKILGAIYLQDSIKPTALPLIDALKSQHITPHILSGDALPNVRRVANALKINHFLAQASPKDKLKFIQNLKNPKTTQNHFAQNDFIQNDSTKNDFAQNDFVKKDSTPRINWLAQKKDSTQIIMMIGDGINDVGALQASDISVSFKEASEVSEKSADIIIYNHDLGKIYYAILLSRAVLANIKQNLFWAFCYNALCIPIACGVLYGFGVLLNPSLAAFAMSASSLSVVLNAQKLWRFNAKFGQKYVKNLPPKEQESQK